MAELKASFKARQESRKNPKKEEYTNFGNSFNKIASLYSRKSIFQIDETEEFEKLRSKRKLSRM